MSVLQAILIQHVTIKMYTYTHHTPTFIRSYRYGVYRMAQYITLLAAATAAITEQSSSSLTQFLRVKFFIPFLHPPSKSPQTTHTRVYILSKFNTSQLEEAQRDRPFFSSSSSFFCRLRSLIVALLPPPHVWPLKYISLLSFSDRCVQFASFLSLEKEIKSERKKNQKNPTKQQHPKKCKDVLIRSPYKQSGRLSIVLLLL
jgi:hypothetical protein